LLVDVDGVISLFGFRPAAPPPGVPLMVEGIPHWLSPQSGACLRRLAERFECVWCTGWEEKAEEYLVRALGLPGGWPHLLLGRIGDSERHWKLGAIESFCGPDRPLAWVDDDLDWRCSEWVAARPGPTRLVRTDPAVGLAEAHVSELLRWADEVAPTNGGH
jgi:hypothetical protein